MKYKISTSGNILTPSEILENKEEVCEHYSILLNALLNSIGIDALYVTGDCINKLKMEVMLGLSVNGMVKGFLYLDTTLCILSGNYLFLIFLLDLIIEVSN